MRPFLTVWHDVQVGQAGMIRKHQQETLLSYHYIFGTTHPHSGQLSCAPSWLPTSTVYGTLPTDISTVNLIVASLSAACSLLIKLGFFD